MDAPKCRLCQEHHYGLCHGKVIANVVKELKARSSTVEPRPLKSEIVGSSPAVPAKKRAPRGSFDRTAYQRELMRKRRGVSK